MSRAPITLSTEQTQVIRAPAVRWRTLYLQSVQDRLLWHRDRAISDHDVI